MTVALANHSVIKAIWYWGSAEVRTKHQHIQQGSDFVRKAPCKQDSINNTQDT